MNAFQKKLFDTAHNLRSLGIIAVPAKGKVPVYKWRHSKQPPPSVSDMRRAFGYSITNALSILCGAISGNVEVVDVDTKNDLEGSLMRRFYNELKALDAALAAKLVLVRTRSGGYHFFYRCNKVSPSHHLARRPATEQELALDPKLKFIVLIETRGDNGTTCVVPSPGYTFIRGSFATIPTISESEREILLSTARLFNQVIEKKSQKRQVTRTKFEGDPDLSPINDYNKRADVVELFQRHGWTVSDNHGDPDKTLFLRPGKTDKDSSGNFNHSLRLFTAFSTNTPFEYGVPYSPAEVFFLLECNLDVRKGGDKTPGVKELLRQGFGKSYKDQRSALKQKAR